MIPPGLTANSPPVAPFAATSIIVGSALNCKISRGLYTLKYYGDFVCFCLYQRNKKLPALVKYSFSSKLTRTLKGASDAEIIGNSVIKQWLKLQYSLI